MRRNNHTPSTRIKTYPHNFQLCGKQHRVTFVIKSILDRNRERFINVDRWVVIEAPRGIRQTIHQLIEFKFGKVRLA